MAAKGRAVTGFETELSPSEATSVLNDVVFLTIPTPVFRALSDAAAQRQQTLAQFLADAVSAALEKPLLSAEKSDNEAKR